jgi:hypothetical protein
MTWTERNLAIQSHCLTVDESRAPRLSSASGGDAAA